MKGLVKQLLREKITEHSQDKLFKEFIVFASEILSIPMDEIPNIVFQTTRDGLKTTASYQKNVIRIYVKDRAVVDVLRSLAHELTHCKQDIEGRLTNPDLDGKTGSPIENEANTMAGIIMRQFGEQHPEIYK
jgi:hypothetical protein